MGDRPNLFAELKRRNVWRAAAFYVAAVWALAQGIAQLGPAIDAPGWITRWFLVAACIGFPFWIAFAWFYAWTPQGFKREEDVERNPALTHGTGRKLDFWIIGILAVAVVLLVTNQFVLHRDATSTANAADAQAAAVANKAAIAALAKIPAQSVAVLPLANESDDPKQQYFSDGLSEELISDLTQVDGLKVIGQYSSFKFRDSKDSPAQIGATLGVANLIEGSVRQSGGRIRIVVNLIRAKDGASVWSHTYDQQLKDVFAIQSQIGHAVAKALQVKLLGKGIVSDDKPPGGNVEAYRLMLQARALNRRGIEVDRRQAITLARQAVALDPDYAYAWGLLSNAEINMGLAFLHGSVRQQVIAEGRKAADREFSLAPDSASAHWDRGFILSALDGDQMGALEEDRRALELAPNDGTAMMFLGYQLAIFGQSKQASALFRKAIATDPLQPGWYAALSSSLTAQGHLDQAERAMREAITLQPDMPDAHGWLAFIDILRGDAAAAQRDAEKETDPRFRAFTLALAKQIGGDANAADAALQAFIAQHGKSDPFGVANLYASRKQPDEMFQWLQRARTTQSGSVSSQLLSDPLLLRYKRDPRFAALCKQLGLPAPGQPLPGVAASTP